MTTRQTPSSGRPLRVMQSFGPPRPTSNPYVHLLDRALAQTPGIEHLRFSRMRALFGRYDVIHFHWPETLFGSSRGAKDLARKAFATLLRARLTVGRVAVVRTAHNVALPTDVTTWEHGYLSWVERRADHRILLNTHTPVPPGTSTTLIPHGHYRDWYAGIAPVAADDSTIGFVGLVRRYKGVEHLIRVFHETADEPGLRLRIAGNPTSQEIARDIRSLAEGDRRIELDLRYLSEEEFATAVMRSAGVVLPYRFMHNSGTVLAALSLDRPVLAPRTEVNEDLAAEVGDGWLRMYDGEIDADDLRAFAVAVRNPPAGRPDLSARGWAEAGIAHRAAYRQAVLGRRSRGRRR